MHQAAGYMKRMPEHCDPTYFWEHLRLYFQGWEKVSVDNAIGVKFESLDADAFVYRGPSGAQSSIVPALDGLFGIKHKVNSMYHNLLSLQQYMPYDHRAFIDIVKGSQIKKMVDTNPSDFLKHAFREAVEGIEHFRLMHLWLVGKYIFRPATTANISKDALSGTGGTPLNHYLGERLETVHNQKIKMDAKISNKNMFTAKSNEIQTDEYLEQTIRLSKL